MSFVYAEKAKLDINGTQKNLTNIYSDTKTTLIGAYKANWNNKTRTVINNYGFIKSVNISPKCSISFAGNDILYAHKLLSWIYENNIFVIDQIIDKASQLHMSTNKDDIEFIICTADKNDNTTITCIKEHNILSNCTSAWIGSYTAFRKLQEIRTDSFTSSYTFRRAVSECSDDSVGGLIIQNTYRQEEHRFVYPEGYCSSYERKQTIKPGENVILSGPAETGAFTTYYHDSTDEVIIDFWQNNTSVIYSTKYRYGSTDVNNSNTKYFLLPAIYNTETGKFL